MSNINFDHDTTASFNFDYTPENFYGVCYYFLSFDKLKDPIALSVSAFNTIKNPWLRTANAFTHVVMLVQHPYLPRTYVLIDNHKGNVDETPTYQIVNFEKSDDISYISRVGLELLEERYDHVDMYLQCAYKVKGFVLQKFHERLATNTVTKKDFVNWLLGLLRLSKVDYVPLCHHNLTTFLKIIYVDYPNTRVKYSKRVRKLIDDFVSKKYVTISELANLVLCTNTAEMGAFTVAEFINDIIKEED